jgi:hypothetical protein
MAVFLGKKIKEERVKDFLFFHLIKLCDYKIGRFFE